MGLEPGTQFDRYVVEELLGVGGMGRVYRAVDTRLRRAVAIKVLEAVTDGAEAQAALREARAAAGILHPNVTGIFDADQVGDTSFIVMELVPGTSLRKLVGEPAVPMGARIQWLVEIAAALTAAHQAGVIHRDVKPENVIVRDDGLVKVLDFGIARLSQAPTGLGVASLSDMPEVWGQSGLLGTPAYMAPEQIQAREIDGRTDQFSWGVVAYELLSGKLPWRHTSGPSGVLEAILKEEPLPLPAEVPAEVSAVVMRALAKDPAARFPGMGDVTMALSWLCTGPRPVLGITPESGMRSRPAPGPVSELRVMSSQEPSSLVPSMLSPPPVAPTLTAGRMPPAPEPFVEPPGPTSAAAITLVPSAEPSVISEPPPARRSSPGLGTPPSARRSSPGLGTPPSARRSSPGLGTPPPARRSSPTLLGPPSFRPPDFYAPVDLHAHVALLPPGASCKGMYFQDLLRVGSKSRTPSELCHLAGIPERRHVAFRDYPMDENMRLAFVVARYAFAGVPIGFALRKFGQIAFATVAESHLGKTLLSPYEGDKDLMVVNGLKMCKLLVSFGEVTTERPDGSTLLVRARDLPAFLETFQVGLIEGLLTHCKVSGRIDIALETLAAATFKIDARSF